MNIVYNASAGTGKTYQVTQLYVELVMQHGVDPRNILLMTFTDNAAEELRLRVAQRLEESRDSGDDRLCARAMNALYRLPSAPISTIHAFCTRLLREHALDSGLSPNFTVIEEANRKELLDQICRDELLNRLVSDADFNAFCSGAHIIGNGGFGSSITETVPNLIAQADSLGISLENAESMLPEPLPCITVDQLRDILNRLEALEKKTKKIIEAIGILSCSLEGAVTAQEVIDRFGKSFKGHFSYGEAKPIYGDFKMLREETVSRTLYQKLYPAGKAFARYVQAVACTFSQRKREMDCVDFDDLLLMAHRLLEAGKVQPAFEYVIVDEVQDTSRIQCALIQNLCRQETGLIICGDKKQSIYTWRGADPQVMPDLEAMIAKREDAETRDLQTSYRSKSPILEVVNNIFCHIYDAYQERDHLLPNPDYTTAAEKPCVEFLSSGPLTEEMTRKQKVEAEMQAVAERIQLLVRGSEEWKPAFRYCGETGTFLPSAGKNSFRYSDILILLRRTSHQEALEHALRHAGVPYTVGGKGRGLFTRQETRDVSLFLNVLTDPTDLFSLVGFLRSPWIGLSDESIARIACSEDGFSADKLTGLFSEDNIDLPAGDEEKKLLFAKEVIGRYRNMSGAKLASEMVRRFISETGYDAVLSGSSRGNQRLANLQKIIDWLREHERGGRMIPATVARTLKEHIANPPNIAEAALPDPNQNAVTLMTVHGSKGLTKRVVFLPDISFRPDPDRAFCRVFADGDTSPLLGLRIGTPTKTSVDSPGFGQAKKQAAEVRSHELKNLFYVALTRARDFVVLSASPGKKPGGWLQDLEPFIQDKTIFSRDYETIRATTREQQLSSIITTGTVPPPEQVEAALLHLPPSPPSARLKRISATRLAKSSAQTEPEPAWKKESGESRIRYTESAADIGSFGHAILEQLALNRWQGSTDEWAEALRHSFGISMTSAKSIAARVENTRALMIETTSNMNELIPELPFVMKSDRDGETTIIDGTIDLLCRRDNTLTIFDYKFTDDLPQHAADTYSAQMKIYHQAVRQAYPNTETVEVYLIIISSSGITSLQINI